MYPPALPDPVTLRRRHEALVAVEDLIRGTDYDFRYYGVDPPEVFWFSSGSGDDYRLVVVGDDALLTAFDHESPWSPWARDDQLDAWPGMFAGLPEHLHARLPERGEDEPLSVSACFWFIDRAWHEGNPQPVERQGDFYDGDPGGSAALLAPLLDPDGGVRELVVDIYEQPERLDDARALMNSMLAGGP